MPRKSRTALDKEISRVQKNTRNKLYRLRKKGAINIPEIDLRLTPQQRAGMTGSQKAAYLRKLNTFNSHINNYTVQQNNIAVPTNTLKAYRAAEQAANDARVGLKSNIEKNIPKQAPKRDVQFDAFATTRYRKDGTPYIPKTNKYQDITPVVMREGFPSVEELKKGIIQSKAALDKIKNNHKKYRSYKKGIAAKMIDNGYGDLAAQIKSLTYAQMDYLHYYTDFDTLVAIYRYEKERDAGMMSTSKSIASMHVNNAKAIEDLIAAAKGIKRTVKY